MDVDLDITDDLDVYVEEDNNNNLDAKEEEDNNIDVLCVQTLIFLILSAKVCYEKINHIAFYCHNYDFFIFFHLLSSFLIFIIIIFVLKRSVLLHFHNFEIVWGPICHISNSSIYQWLRSFNCCVTRLLSCVTRHPSSRQRNSVSSV